MKLSDFILLDEQEKKMTVLQEGILIAKRINSDCLVFLFQMNGYYIETYCSLKNKSIEEYRVFDNPKYLHPYLEAICIDDLFS